MNELNNPNWRFHNDRNLVASSFECLGDYTESKLTKHINCAKVLRSKAIKLADVARINNRMDILEQLEFSNLIYA